LRDKIVTQDIYFNEAWRDVDGGGLLVLRSSDANDVHHTIVPSLGNSAILVRSDNSWHAVKAVSKSINGTRRSLTAVFYQPGSVSTMWPPGDETPLHDYVADSR
jgi:Rps23 Pro-64 3,4-dihydroxylase Tpa1-like proline 4-hydroxylase